MEKYRRKNDPVRKNQEGQVLYEPTSRQVLHRQGYWIPHRKRVYHLWFSFLQLCERDSSRIVDWKKYEGWGGSNLVLGSKFDDWWRDNWKELFATPERGDTPRFTTDRRITGYDALRYAYLVVEYGVRFPELGTYDLSQKIQERESRKRYAVPSFTEGIGIDGGGIDKRVIQRRMWNYRKKGQEIMDHVCEGRFP